MAFVRNKNGEAVNIAKIIKMRKIAKYDAATGNGAVQAITDLGQTIVYEGDRPDTAMSVIAEFNGAMLNPWDFSYLMEQHDRKAQKAFHL